jgi:hypothetical protein
VGIASFAAILPFFTIAFIAASLHCADTSSQSALVSRGFVAVDDLLVHQRVDNGDCCLISGRSRFLVSTSYG